MKANEKIAIVGAGPIGSLLAINMAKLGHEVQVYEKRSDSRLTTHTQGRSINIALSHRAWHALDLVGLKEKVQSMAIPMKGRSIHNLDGAISFQPYSKEGQSIWSISRKELNEYLVSSAEKQGVTFSFGEPVDGTHPLFASSFDAIFGTDGLYSSVRSVVKEANPVYTTLEHGYKEFTIPPSDSWVLDPNSLHIWPRRKFMLIALPNTDKSFTCTLFLSLKGEESFESIVDWNAFFKANFGDILHLMPDVQEQAQIHPTGMLTMVHCSSWCDGDKTLLLGDAAHAIVPFYGQGMNAGFEDVRLFMENWHDRKSSMQLFTSIRKADTDAIAQLALYNFVEMRDTVSSPNHLRKKELDFALAELLGKKWEPVYTLVSFTDTPYHQALEKLQIQNKILEEILHLEASKQKEPVSIHQDEVQQILARYELL
jgi:kynurenine 3-monooxygenase